MREGRTRRFPALGVARSSKASLAFRVYLLEGSIRVSGLGSVKVPWWYTKAVRTKKENTTRSCAPRSPFINKDS